MRPIISTSTATSPQAPRFGAWGTYAFANLLGAGSVIAVFAASSPAAQAQQAPGARYATRTAVVAGPHHASEWAPIGFAAGQDLVVDETNGNSPFAFSGMDTFNNVIVGATTTGTLNQGGGNLTASSGFSIGNSSGSTGNYHLTSGTLTAPSTINIGNGGTGTFTQSGGTFDGRNGFFAVSIANAVGSTGTVNLSGTGMFQADFETVGGRGTGVFNQSGGTNTVANTLVLGSMTGATGTYNLDGGTLRVSAVVTLDGRGTFNFNGGTLQAGANLKVFFTGPTSNVRNGGAVIDSNGFDIGIPSYLVHSTISDDAATDGGLTKLGAGSVSLFGANTYTGATQVKGGTLFVSNPGGIGNGVVFVSINAGLGGNGTIGGDVTVGVSASPSNSSGTISAPGQPNISSNFGTLTPGATGPGDAGILRVNGSLTFTTAALLELDLGGTRAGAGGHDQVSVGGQITLDGNLKLTLANGFALTVGDKFYVLDSFDPNPVAGTFANDTPLGPTTGLFTDADGHTFLVNYADRDPFFGNDILFNDVSLTYLGVNVPEPSTWALLLVGGLGAAALGRRATRGAAG